MVKVRSDYYCCLLCIEMQYFFFFFFHIFVYWQIGIPNSLTIEYRIDIACRVREKKEKRAKENPVIRANTVQQFYYWTIIFLYAFHGAVGVRAVQCNALSVVGCPFCEIFHDSKIAIKCVCVCVYTNEARNIVPVAAWQCTLGQYNANRHNTHSSILFTLSAFTHRNAFWNIERANTNTHTPICILFSIRDEYTL